MDTLRFQALIAFPSLALYRHRGSVRRRMLGMA
jgi:hypothetical protein